MFLNNFFLIIFQELEELVKEKEKDLEKAEERGNVLIQKEKGSACSVVRETLTILKQSWARLDQMVNHFYPLKRCF